MYCYCIESVNDDSFNFLSFVCFFFINNNKLTHAHEETIIYIGSDIHPERVVCMYKHIKYEIKFETSNTKGINTNERNREREIENYKNVVHDIIVERK